MPGTDLDGVDEQLAPLVTLCRVGGLQPQQVVTRPR